MTRARRHLAPVLALSLPPVLAGAALAQDPATDPATATADQVVLRARTGLDMLVVDAIEAAAPSGDRQPAAVAAAGRLLLDLARRLQAGGRDPDFALSRHWRLVEDYTEPAMALCLTVEAEFPRSYQGSADWPLSHAASLITNYGARGADAAETPGGRADASRVPAEVRPLLERVMGNVRDALERSDSSRHRKAANDAARRILSDGAATWTSLPFTSLLLGLLHDPITSDKDLAALDGCLRRLSRADAEPRSAAVVEQLYRLRGQLQPILGPDRTRAALEASGWVRLRVSRPAGGGVATPLGLALDMLDPAGNRVTVRSRADSPDDGLLQVPPATVFLASAEDGTVLLLKSPDAAIRERRVSLPAAAQDDPDHVWLYGDGHLWRVRRTALAVQDLGALVRQKAGNLWERNWTPGTDDLITEVNRMHAERPAPWGFWTDAAATTEAELPDEFKGAIVRLQSDSHRLELPGAHWRTLAERGQRYGGRLPLGHWSLPALDWTRDTDEPGEPGYGDLWRALALELDLDGRTPDQVWHPRRQGEGPFISFYAEPIDQ